MPYNVGVFGDVLLDTGIRGDELRIMRPIQGRKKDIQGPLDEQ